MILTMGSEDIPGGGSELRIHAHLGFEFFRSDRRMREGLKKARITDSDNF